MGGNKRDENIFENNRCYSWYGGNRVGLTYGMLHYLNNSKPAAKKASPAAPAVEVLADSNVKAEDAKIFREWQLFIAK